MTPLLDYVRSSGSSTAVLGLGGQTQEASSSQRWPGDMAFQACLPGPCPLLFYTQSCRIWVWSKLHQNSSCFLRRRSRGIYNNLTSLGQGLEPTMGGARGEGEEPKAGRLGEWGFPGLVCALTHFAQHLPCTDWGKSGGPARKNQRCPVRGLERKGNLESSLKGEPCGQEGVEENKGLWETREALCASKGLWV